MQAIVIATKTGRCLPVLLESINQYVPDDVTIYLSGYDHILPNHRTITMPNDGDNFGDSYNAVVQKAFEEHDEIIVANDDIVLTPHSYLLLEQDIERLKDHLARIDVSPKLGWVASRSDYVREAQNIRFGKVRHGDKYKEEYCINEVEIISPLFAYISKDAWVDFKPINWYSDDIQCLEMVSMGYQNFISRSYVHHVGSQTIGTNNQKNHLDAKAWIDNNMPDFSKEFFK
jgi:hypothetical protein